jgi:hypothetical protein
MPWSDDACASATTPSIHLRTFNSLSAIYLDKLLGNSHSARNILLTRKWLRRFISRQDLQPLAQENGKVKSAKSVHNTPGVELLLPQVVDTHLNGEIQRINGVQQSFGQMRSTPGNLDLSGPKRHARRITAPQCFSATHVKMQSDVCQAEQ